MNENEEKILQTIIDYIKENMMMPTYRYIQNKHKYKSINSISQYIKSLEKKGYLKRNNDGKIIINNFNYYYNDAKRISIINSKHSYIDLILNKRKNYLGYRMNNSFFEKRGVLKNDLLVIEQNKKPNQDDLALFLVDNKYRIMRYDYKDGFYILEDNEKIILNHVKILGKVIQIIRKI